MFKVFVKRVRSVSGETGQSINESLVDLWGLGRVRNAKVLLNQ
jgi:hypothetical protein